MYIEAAVRYELRGMSKGHETKSDYVPLRRLPRDRLDNLLLGNLLEYQ
jgi:hypothetical protein